ncbi:hypothetical protein V8G54_037524 [Vigna mungo]|uniref:Uncharacterized protein n=1 Tax=Vigna mungo TaxID=3915 RepID=A0AAQ3MJI6_VIGMU
MFSFRRLNDNRLTGPIPKDLAAVSSLKVVDVSNNDLCGTIPTSGPFEHIPLNNNNEKPSNLSAMHCYIYHLQFFLFYEYGVKDVLFTFCSRSEYLGQGENLSSKVDHGTWNILWLCFSFKGDAYEAKMEMVNKTSK